ncbi:MAG: hypothetical protein GTN53_28880 [Candidatus Aminicenantes bacterium]|nr:hypothetical protein [Candidatus Aminicenantes bacterium]NIQ70487.1 hypothetical protein [Candidatus Aminicenantes bacterium]NIT26528.1 hypothetical protein [Candidatus Aminicenantes bacterium]
MRTRRYFPRSLAFFKEILEVFATSGELQDLAFVNDEKITFGRNPP